MVKARISEDKKVLLVFDTVQSKEWLTAGRVTSTGITPIVKQLIAAGVQLSSISIVCLSDAQVKPKAADFKVKQDYIKELLETFAFNVCVPIGAVATEKLLGFKGASKYFGKPMYSETIKDLKIIPCPNPAAAKHVPAVAQQVTDAIAVVAENQDFREIREAEKAELRYTVVDTIGKFNDFISLYASPKVTAFAYDTETSGFGFNTDELLTIQFSHKETCSHLIPTPFYEGIWTHDEWAYIMVRLQLLFADERKTVIGHNIKFDNKFIYNWLKIPVRKNNVFDTMIASFLCDENTPNGLKDLACKHTDLGDYEFELDKWKKVYCKTNKVKVKDFSYKFIPLDILTYYAQADADVTFRLYNYFKEQLVVEEQTEVFDMVMRFQYLLTKMEITGSPTDVEYAKTYLIDVDKQIEELSAELGKVESVLKAEEIINSSKKKPKPFNFNSVPQKRILFFDVLKLRFAYFSKVKSDIKTFTLSKKMNLARKLYKEMQGADHPDSYLSSPEIDRILRLKASTDKRSLAVWLSETEDPEVKSLIELLKRYSELVKIRKTYIFSIIEQSVDGWIHPTFNVIGARSGRLSCKNPNYQNIPAHSDEAKKVKRITKAPEGWVLVGADLSAAEMRWVTIASGDTKMAAIFNSGVDSHGAIAKEIFDLDCEPNEVKDQYPLERQISKACQFLSIYGGKADALAATAGISVEKAEEILNDYFEKYTGIAEFIERTAAFIKIHGYSKSLLGRKNRQPAVTSILKRSEESLSREDIQEIEKGLRVGINATIQSVSSDGMLIAACNLQDEIEANDLPMKIINVIHDAIYCVVREDFMIQGRDIILKHLTSLPEKLIDPFTGALIVPPISMGAEAEHGPSWDKFSSDFGVFMPVDDEDEEEDEEDD